MSYGKMNGFVHKRTGINTQKLVKMIVSDPMRSSQFKQMMVEKGALKDLGNNKFGLGDLSDLDNITQPMFEFPVIANEFLSALYNKVGRTWVRNKIATNDLAMFKTGDLPWGATVEETHTNPADDYQFDPDGPANILMTRAEPDVKVAYHTINRQKQYKTTVQRELLKRAFTGYDAFGELIDTIINSLYNGNTIEEQRLIKQLFGSSYTENHVIKMQIADPETSEANAKAMTAKLRALSKKFKRASTLYNPYLTYADADQTKPRFSWVEPENQIIVITDDLEAYLDVNVLAYAYNITKAELERQIVTIDQFEDADGAPIPAIKAMIMDKTFTQIYTSDEISGEWYNPAGLFYNYFLTLFQIYSVSPFANCVALTTETVTP